MDNLVYAKTKNVRISPRKARLVIDLIRGQKVTNLVDKLNLLNKKGGKIVAKVLKSAIANAENNFDMNAEKLVVAEARVDEGFTFKRGKPVSRGRYHQVLKRTSSIVIGLKQI